MYIKNVIEVYQNGARRGWGTIFGLTVGKKWVDNGVRVGESDWATSVEDGKWLSEYPPT